MKFIVLSVAMFVFSTLHSQPIDIVVSGQEVVVVNHIKKEYWYTGYSYKITGDCATWQSPIFLPQDTVFLDPPVEFFSNAFTVGLVIHTPWNTLSSTCVRTWYPKEVEIVNVSSGPVQLNCTLPQFEWYDAIVANNTIRLVPNDLILPQTTIDTRVVTNALGQIVYLGTEDIFTVPGKGIYFCLTLLKGQGGTFLAGNSVSTW